MLHFIHSLCVMVWPRISHLIDVLMRLCRCFFASCAMALKDPVFCCRSSCIYGTCCLRGKTYSIGFLRFCKQVHILITSQIFNINTTKICFICCFKKESQWAVCPYNVSSIPIFCSFLCLFTGNFTILCCQTSDGRYYSHPAGLREIPRW